MHQRRLEVVLADQPLGWASSIEGAAATGLPSAEKIPIAWAPSGRLTGFT
jgi:hypothetical protein